MAKPLDFYLYPYDEHDPEIVAIHEHIEADRLPFDSLFRIAGIGYNQLDPIEERPKRLQWKVLQDIITHADDWGAMRQESRQVLDGPLPDTIVDVGSQPGKPYATLDPMYYTMGNLARAIRENRAEQQTTAQPTGTAFHQTFVADEYEKQICRGLARPIWRSILQRYHPDWLADPETYYPSTFIGFTDRVYEISAKEVRRQLIGHAVICDTVVYDFYDEVVQTGVRGIGPQGKESLRRLLEDEHLELSRDAIVEPVSNPQTWRD